MQRKVSLLWIVLSLAAATAYALTPTPTLTDGSCGPGLAASVVPGATPVVYLTGNLNAGTPQNPAGGQGYAYGGFVPDASVDFRVYDSLGTPRDLRIAFEQTSAGIGAAPPQWSYYVVDVSGGQQPNGSAWVEGGPGDLIASGSSIVFNTTGGLLDNSNVGADIELSLPVSNGATSPFNIHLNFGTDANADPAQIGLSDGLTGRWCTQGTPTYTPTPVPVATSCAVGPYALVTPGLIPRVLLKGNMNACIPQNPAGGAGYGFTGFAPDLSVDFRVFDSLGAPHDLRVSFEQTGDTANGQPAAWNFYINDVSGGQVPNDMAWSGSGPGNLIDSGGPIVFHADGSLEDNSNGGADWTAEMPLTNGAQYFFDILINFGTDDAWAAAYGPAVGLRDGLTGDACCSATATMTLSATLSPTPTPTATSCGACTSTLPATPSSTPVLGTATCSSTVTPTPTWTSAVPASLPALGPGGSNTVVPAANPSAPTPANPLILYYAVPAGSMLSSARLLIFSPAGVQIAALPCVVCVGPTLSFSWDGSGVANGLYFAAVDLGTGSSPKGQFPLMVSH